MAPRLDRGFYSVDLTPRSLSDGEVVQLIKDFGEATRRAIEAGFDGVELHGATGYIIQQFFSLHSNTRTDRWGGSLEKRLAFPLAFIEETSQSQFRARQPTVYNWLPTYARRTRNAWNYDD